MNTLADTNRRACHRDGHIVMASGIEVRFPIVTNLRLARGSPAQLNRIELSPLGLHWSDLDEDLSIRGLLDGNFGQHQKSVR
jgi:hypothetical protein